MSVIFMFMDRYLMSDGGNEVDALQLDTLKINIKTILNICSRYGV